MNDRPVLDPETVHVSAHACQRWLERRGLPDLARVHRGWQLAEEEIRAKLVRLVDQCPPIRVHEGQPARRFLDGRVTFILSPDLDTVITVLVAPKSPPERRKGKHHPRRAGRRPRFEDVDDGTDGDEGEETA